jgi:hypothetical protein
MKKFLVFAMLLLTVGSALAANPFDKKDKGNSGKLLTGRVTDKDDNPLASAVVYLSNTRSHAVKTFICGADGVYRFPALSQNDDYEIYAQLKGKKSDTKTVSQFDNRSQVTMNLKIDMR